WRKSGDENGAAAHPARIQIRERLHGAGQRVGAGMQGDLARLGQRHQLGQVVVGADDVAHDVALGGDDVERGDLQRAAVPDDEVRTARGGHVPAVHLGALLGHEVQYDVGAYSAGQVLDRVHLGAVGHYGVTRAELL